MVDIFFSEFYLGFWIPPNSISLVSNSFYLDGAGVVVAEIPLNFFPLSVKALLSPDHSNQNFLKDASIQRATSAKSHKATEMPQQSPQKPQRQKAHASSYLNFLISQRNALSPHFCTQPPAHQAGLQLYGEASSHWAFGKDREVSRFPGSWHSPSFWCR